MRKLTPALLAILALLLSVTTAAAQAKPPKQIGRDGVNSTTGISGLASSAKHCIASTGTKTHDLGAMPSGTRITITFLSDFDPVAGVTILQMGIDAPDGRARASYVYDDDTGGNLEPEIRFTTSHSGTAVLHVGKYSSTSSAGCYYYKAEIQTP